MAKKKLPTSAKTKSVKSKKVSKNDAEKAIAVHTIKRKGLPKGEVVKLLEENKVDPKLIEKVASRLVPYGHTDDRGP